MLLRPSRAISRQAGSPEQPQAKTHAEDMVRCAHCGVHLPLSEAIMAQGKYYCSEAHRLAHRNADADGDAG